MLTYLTFCGHAALNSIVNSYAPILASKACKNTSSEIQIFLLHNSLEEKMGGGRGLFHTENIG